MRRKNLFEEYPDRWAHCSFCKGYFPIERGLSNRKNRPRINKESGLCTSCEKLGAVAQLGERDVRIVEASGSIPDSSN